MLTSKQQRFVDEYLIDLNATQAAIRAGYAKRNANRQASQLLDLPEIATAIDATKAERSEQIGIDAEWVLRRLIAEAEADLADLYDEKGALLPIENWPLIWRQGLVQGIEVEELFEGRGEDREHIVTVRKIKFDSRFRRVEMIGKHVAVNAFRKQIEVNSFDGLADHLRRLREQHEIEEAQKAAEVEARIQRLVSERLAELTGHSRD